MDLNFVSKVRWKIVLISFLVSIFFQFPHIYALLQTPDGYVFAGQAAWFDPWDVNVYLSAIRWAQEFGWYFQNTYTTISHQSIVFYPLYTAIGLLFPAVSPLFLYSVLKVPAGMVLVYSVYKVSRVFLNENKALLATVVASFAGGFGGLLYGTASIPDISITPFILYSAFEKPHEALAISFYLLSLANLFLFYKNKERTRLWRSAILFVPVIILYPYYLMSYYLLVGLGFLLYTFSVDEIVRHVGRAILVTLPFGVFYSWYLLSSEGFSNVTSPYLGTPHPFYMVLGYGVFFFVLLYGVRRNFEDKTISTLYLWFFLNVFLSYTPLSFARYYLRGLFVPLSILLVYLLPSMAKKFSVKPRTLMVVLGVFLFMTNGVIYIGRAWRVHVDKTYYMELGENEMITYLDTVPVGSGILSGYELGNLIPAYTANRVYYGHAFQTPDSGAKAEELTKFYRNEMTEEEATEFLSKNAISYVVWGEEEQTLSENEELKYQMLDQVFKNEVGTVFSVAMD